MVVYRLAGRAQYYAGDHEKAASFYEKASTVDGAAFPAWEGLADILLADGKLSEAAEQYKHLVRI